MSNDLIDMALDDQPPPGRYQFALHGRPERDRPRRRRDEPRRREPYAVIHPDQFVIARCTAPENLEQAYQVLEAHGGAAPGIDGLTFWHFSPSERYDVFRAASAAIREGTYYPHPVRPVRFPKGDGRYRELSLKTMGDRTIAKSLHLALNPYWRSVLPNLGIDPWRIYARLDWVMIHHGWFHLGQADIRDCFPSARLDDVLADHREHIRQPDLLRLVTAVVQGHEGSRRVRGLDQGCPYSPDAMELRLRNARDRRLRATGPHYPLLSVRYVDNLVHTCSSAPVVRQALQLDAELLAPHGFALKETDLNSVDVRDPQHCQKVLGLIPRWRDDHLGWFLSETAYDKLREKLQKAHTKPNPAIAARRTILGWLRWLAPVYVDTAAYEIVSQTQRIAAENGFRETATSHELWSACSNSWRNWLAIRQEVFEMIASGGCRE